ncbi:MAG: family 10 glycosylhydrolase [Gemmatimonadaceae bacterium]
MADVREGGAGERNVSESRSRATRLLQGVVLAGGFASAACSTSGVSVSNPTAPVPAGTAPAMRDTSPPPIVREMRGVWIATVANIDWPSRTSLSADQQRAELVDLLDRAAAGGFNAVVFHVRPAGDAVYRSTLEPWAAMLTGRQGTDPGYDPLSYAIEQAHQRGLELHAWINPFRAGSARDTTNLAATHSFTVRRDVLRVYGPQLWFDPGEPAVQDHVMRVVNDIVQRYDIDAIHADDYFYPYQAKDSAGAVIDFPDSTSYARSGSTLSRADWRRDNVDRFVERMNREVHQRKPVVKVGISPFGIWRPGNPSGVVGLDAYATIYADSRKWLQQGWVDYLAPQLYWAITSPQQSYPALFDWWREQNVKNRHLWPGLASYRVSDGTPNAYGTGEIADQVALTRARAPGTGHILYNATTTLKRANGAVVATVAPLQARRALVPASPWLDGVAPVAPTIAISGRSLLITPSAGEAARWWYVRVRSADGWMERTIFGDTRTIMLDADPLRVMVNAIDQAGNASAAADWRRP